MRLHLERESDSQIRSWSASGLDGIGCRCPYALQTVAAGRIRRGMYDDERPARRWSIIQPTIRARPLPDITDIILKLVGAFYAFAGVVAARAAMTSYFMDSAFAAISGGRADPVERQRSAWLIGAAWLVFAGGVALAAGLDMARWLFLASAAGQAVYLFALAPMVFDKADPPDPRGRRQTTNAFVIYVAATAFVLWAGAVGRLTAFADAHPLLLAAVAVVCIAFAGWIARHTFLGRNR